MAEAPTALHRLLLSANLLADEDCGRLDALLERREERSAATIIVSEGVRLRQTFVMLEGWALRHKTLPDGKRQILNFLLPGDIICLFAPFLGESEFGVEALTDVVIASFTPEQLLDAFRESPRLAIALTWSAAKAERLLDEQIVRIGRRPAYHRMAHLLLELARRCRLAGASSAEATRLPLTQSVLADALGMSHVHANRTFRELSKKGLVRHDGGDVLLLDREKLAELAGFDASYLDPDPMSDAARRLYFE